MEQQAASGGGRARVWLIRASCSLLGALLCWLLAEAAYRLWRVPGLGPTTNPSFSIHDARLGWRYRPGTRAKHRSAEFDVTIEIGARGFRGEWPVPREDGIRVLVLGDSFAFGWGVEREQTLSARLASLEPRLQVWNAAVSGYGTDQQVLLLEQLAPEIRPHAVVYVYCRNDLIECTSSRIYGRTKPWFEVAGEPGSEGELLLRGVPVPDPWWMRWSLLARALVKMVEPRVPTAAAARPGHDWRLLKGLVRELSRIAGAAPLIVVSAEPELAELAKAVDGVEQLDLDTVLALDPNTPSDPDFYPVDGHWTPRGHERVAEALARRLRELVP